MSAARTKYLEHVKTQLQSIRDAGTFKTEVFFIFYNFLAYNYIRTSCINYCKRKKR